MCVSRDHKVTESMYVCTYVRVTLTFFFFTEGAKFLRITSLEERLIFVCLPLWHSVSFSLAKLQAMVLLAAMGLFVNKNFLLLRHKSLDVVNVRHRMLMFYGSILNGSMVSFRGGAIGGIQGILNCKYGGKILLVEILILYQISFLTLFLNHLHFSRLDSIECHSSSFVSHFPLPKEKKTWKRKIMIHWDSCDLSKREEVITQRTWQWARHSVPNFIKAECKIQNPFSGIIQ